MSPSQVKTLVFVVNVDWFFLSHRLPLALEAIDRGWKVILVCKDSGKFEEIQSYGIIPINLGISRSGKNIIQERKVISQLTQIYKEFQPDIVHHVTLKVAIYGSLAAKRAGVLKVVNAISGLGFNFTDGRKSITQMIILALMRKAFKKQGFTFIFQNPDDELMFNKLGLGKDNHAEIIKGSGVDLDYFGECPMPMGKEISFVLTARMLRDKGINEFINAAILTETTRPGKGRYHLVGGIDTANPAAYSKEELTELLNNSPVVWEGFKNNVLEILQSANVVVLPSYREGLPKSLIEAAAVGRPILTTDAVGCRECVEHQVNGFLTPVGDAAALSKFMVMLIDDEELRAKMGKESRRKAEKEFSIDSVIEKTFAIYLEDEN